MGVFDRCSLFNGRILNENESWDTQTEKIINFNQDGINTRIAYISVAKLPIPHGEIIVKTDNKGTFLDLNNFKSLIKELYIDFDFGDDKNIFYLSTTFSSIDMNCIGKIYRCLSKDIVPDIPDIVLKTPETSVERHVDIIEQPEIVPDIPDIDLKTPEVDNSQTGKLITQLLNVLHAQSNAPVSVYTNALKLAARHGEIQFVKFLVSNGADIIADDNEALRIAAKNGHLEVVKYLVLVGESLAKKDMLEDMSK